MQARAFSRALRERHFYSVPVAGTRIGLSRSQAYVAARQGIIPAERIGKFLLVPRGRWDKEVRRLLGGPTSAHLSRQGAMSHD